MAAVQMYPQALRRAVNMPIEALPVAIPATANLKYRILSDIAAADLANAQLWVFMGLEIEDAAAPGGWRGGGGARFQLGPYTGKDGVVVPAGQNRGFQVDAAVLAGKNVRLVGECRFVPTGTDPETVGPNWQTWAFADITMGVTREAVG